MRTASSAGPEPTRSRSFTETARRAQIVDEAIRTLADVGYAQASLGAIARNLGISKGVISYHFANKDDLIRECVATTLADSAEFMRERRSGASTPAEELRAYIEGNVAYLRTHRSHVLALIEIYNARVADYLPEGAARVVALEDLLARGQREGTFRAFAGDVMAISIRAAIEAIPHLMRGRPDVDLEDYGRELAELFLAATASVTEVRTSSRSRRTAGRPR